jgi:iron(III) transport system substrate-binding protein
MEAVKKGAPVEIVFPDQDDMGTFVVPNTVALVKGGPNSDNGKKLVEYLASKEVEKKLVESGFCEVPIHESNKNISTIATNVKTMEVSFEDIFNNVENVKNELSDIFVR